MSLCACSTAPPAAEPVRVRLTAAMVQPCEPLPALQAQPGEDLRPLLLANRVESERVHAECSARHRAVVQAVEPRANPRRGVRAPRVFNRKETP